MSTGTVVKDFIKVEGVNIKISDKLPEAFRNTLAGSVKTATGWFNVRKGLDITNFVKDGTYEVEIEISEKGNKMITAILSLGDKGTEGIATTAATAKPYTGTKTDKAVFEKRDNSMEAGGIMHDAVALAIGVGVAGLSEDEAIGLVHRLAVKLLVNKRDLQG